MAHFCTNCGAKIEDGMRFCPNCGAEDTYVAQGNGDAVFGDQPQSTYSAPPTEKTFDTPPAAENTYTTPPANDLYGEPPAAPVPPVPPVDPAPGAGQQNTYDAPPYSAAQPQQQDSGRKHLPGYGLSIAALIFGIIGGWLGLIFGIIALVKNKDNKDKGINIRSILGIVLWAVWFIVFITR